MKDKLEAQVIKCEMCGGIAHREVLDYHVEDLLGMRVGIVQCVEKVTCDGCGEEFIIIPDVNGLIAAAAVARAMTSVRMTGQEVKFLRKAIDLKAKDLAEILQVRPETVSRWEHDQEPIGFAEQKVLSILIGKTLKGEKDKAPGIKFDDVAILKTVLRPHIRAVDGKPLLVFWRESVQEKEEEQLWLKAA